MNKETVNFKQKKICECEAKKVNESILFLDFNKDENSKTPVLDIKTNCSHSNAMIDEIQSENQQNKEDTDRFETIKN